jgi:hypothetical protein
MAAETSTLRALAEREAQLGMVYLARAFNVCDNPKVPYCWTREMLNQYEGLAIHIVRLIETAPIVKRREPIDPERMSAASAAERDAGFQRFLGRLNVGQGPTAA